jgi:hypothetical protein
MSPSSFLCQKLIGICFGLAFGSLIAQAEMFTGQCGLSSSAFHGLFLVVAVCSFLLSLGVVMNAKLFNLSDSSALQGLSISYAILSYSVFGELMRNDFLLIQAGFAASLDSQPLLRIIISQSLFTAFASKVTLMNTSSSDLLNQPFPFTPVWHIAQIPETFTEILFKFVTCSECFLSIAIVALDSLGPALAVLGLCVYYGLMGNFNWTVLILTASGLRLVSSQIIQLVIGPSAFHRWGYQNLWPLNEPAAEGELFAAIIDSAKVFGGIAVLVLVLSYLPIQVVLAVVSAAIFALALFKTKSTPKILGLVILGIVTSGQAFISSVTLNTVPFQEDYSMLPVGYTFAESFSTSRPQHSGDGRSVYLLQTKFTQIGTNTVGDNLGGTRYAELSLPGSVHGDETRPPFLVGHFPRLATRLWRIGTGKKTDVDEGLRLMATLEKIVESGSNAIRVMFSNADESVLSALIGKVRKNQVQGFVQMYSVTHRAADHQWWKRDFEKAVALPTKEYRASTKPIPSLQCTPIIPGKILEVPMELILTTSVVGAMLVAILFLSQKPQKRSQSSTAVDQKK